MALDLSTVKPNFILGDSSKRPFVFLHGNSQNSSCGQGILEFFHGKGHSVLSYDLPGHGHTPMPEQPYQFSDLIDLNLAVLQQYQIESPILGGHSLGGMIQSGSVVSAGLKNSSLILCGSFDANPSIYNRKYFSDSFAAEFDQSLKQYLEDGFKLFQEQQFYHYFNNRTLPDEAVNVINRQFNHPLASQFNLTTLNDFDCRESLISMKTPILVLHGEDEDVIHPELVRQMAIENPAVSIEWYPKGRHNAFYQQYELTMEWLAKHYRFIAS